MAYEAGRGRFETVLKGIRIRLTLHRACQSRLGASVATGVSPNVDRVGPLQSRFDGGSIELVDLEIPVVIARLECPLRLNVPELAFTSDGTRIVLPDFKGHILHVWDLRVIREELAGMGLDWDMPPYPSVPQTQKPEPLRVEINLGELKPSS